MLLYADDIFIIHHDGMKALKDVDKFFKMKPGSIGYPDICLEANLRKFMLPNGL